MSTMSEPPPTDAGLFGTDFDLAHDEVIILGVPWEPTVSYGRGTSSTPTSLIPASHQLDFFVPALGEDFGETVGMAPVPTHWQEANQTCIGLADQVHRGDAGASTAACLAEVNRQSARLNRELAELTQSWREQGRLTGVLGGDHASPLGHIQACLGLHPGAGVLHFDAHHDLREAYEGFTYSHASVMFNLLREVPQVGRLVSVGIRDFSREEFQFAQRHAKIRTFYDRDLKAAHFKGIPWREQCALIAAELPQEVYISLDIDGLEPTFCPHTGTPVPGGLTYDQVVYLLWFLVEKGHQLIGFDLVEVAPDLDHPHNEWDLNVGARLLWQLSLLLARQDRLRSS